MLRVLHAGCMTPLRISVHVKKLVDHFWRLNVVHIALLLRRPVRCLRCFVFRAFQRLVLRCVERGVVFWRRAKMADFMPALQEICLRAADVRRLAPRGIMVWHTAIAPRSRAAELLEVSKIPNHAPVLLTCDGSVAGFAHQVEHPRAALVLASEVCRLMARKCCLVNEVCLAQLAHKRPAQDGRLRVCPQLIACYVLAWYIWRQARRRSHDLQYALLVFSKEL